MQQYTCFGDLNWLLQCILLGLPLNIWKMQLTQNVLTQAICELYWLTIGFQIEFETVAIIYKALQGMGLGYMKDYLTSIVSAWKIWQ